MRYLPVFLLLVCIALFAFVDGATASLVGTGTLLGYVAVTSKPGGSFYRSIWYGAVPVPLPLRIDPSNFKGSSFVDADGYLKAGTPLQANLQPIFDAGQTVKYLVPNVTKIAEGNTDAQLDASPNQDVGLVTEGTVIQSNIEWNVGRVLNANELAAIAANNKFVLF